MGVGSVLRVSLARVTTNGMETATGRGIASQFLPTAPCPLPRRLLERAELRPMARLWRAMDKAVRVIADHAGIAIARVTGGPIVTPRRRVRLMAASLLKLARRVRAMASAGMTGGETGAIVAGTGRGAMTGSGMKDVARR